MSTATLTRPQLISLPANATWNRQPQRPAHLRPCQTRPANWWDTGDPGNAKAIAICGTCPFTTKCKPDPKEDVAGTIRAGVPYDDEGHPIRSCPTCGDPIIRQPGNPICVNGHGTIAQHHAVIAELRGQGHTFAAIGDRIGYGASAVARYWRNQNPDQEPDNIRVQRLPVVHGASRGRPQDHHDVIVQMLSDLDAQYTYQEVAYVIGSTTDAVKSYWRRHQKRAALAGQPVVDRRQVCNREARHRPLERIA